MDRLSLIRALTETLSANSEAITRAGESAARVPRNVPAHVADAFFVYDLSRPIADVLLQSEPFTSGNGFAVPNEAGHAGFYADDAASALVSRVLNGDNPENAVDWLERVLAIEQAVGLTIMALWGVEISSPTDLGSDVTLMPFSALPDSQTKAWFLEARDRRALPSFLMSMFAKPPSAALSCRHVVRPVLQRLVDGRFPDHPNPHQHSAVLDDARLALTMLGPCCPISAGTWFQFEDPDLADIRVHGGITSNFQDVAPWPFVQPGKINPPEAGAVVAAFLQQPDPLRAALRLALGRLNQAVRRPPQGDRAIDLAIALESLLVDNPGEHTFKLALRAALVVSGQSDQMRRVRSVVAALYSLRSALMHDGRLPSDVKVVGSGKLPSAQVVEEATHICAQVLRAILMAGEVPNWYDLELARGAT